MEACPDVIIPLNVFILYVMDLIIDREDVPWRVDTEAGAGSR